MLPKHHWQSTWWFSPLLSSSRVNLTPSIHALAHMIYPTDPTMQRQNQMWPNAVFSTTKQSWCNMQLLLITQQHCHHCPMTMTFLTLPQFQTLPPNQYLPMANGLTRMRLSALYLTSPALGQTHLPMTISIANVIVAQMLHRLKHQSQVLLPPTPSCPCYLVNLLHSHINLDVLKQQLCCQIEHDSHHIQVDASTDPKWICSNPGPCTWQQCSS